MSLVGAILFTGISTYAIDGNEDFNLHILKNNRKVITFTLNKVTKAGLTIYYKEANLIYSKMQQVKMEF